MMFAQYNRWANGRLYDAVRHLGEEEFHRNLGAYFRSMNGTLNHILVTDRIWMTRFTGEGEAPDSLDIVLFEDLPELREARMAEDERIGGFIERLGKDDFGKSIRYKAYNRTVVFEQPLHAVLGHFFNHQTHHRGQAHCMLTQLGREAPPLDLVYFQRDSGVGMA